MIEYEVARTAFPGQHPDIQQIDEAPIMIVKTNNGIRRTNYGVDFRVLAYGTQSMVTKMMYKPGDAVPEHTHPNEQSGYVLSGRYRIRFPGHDQEIGPGDSYSILANVAHSLDVLEAGEVLDIFAPPRNDFLEGVEYL
jgi:quercetin dioxygenase-like cupin family protein